MLQSTLYYFLHVYGLMSTFDRNGDFIITKKNTLFKSIIMLIPVTPQWKQKCFEQPSYEGRSSKWPTPAIDQLCYIWMCCFQDDWA